MRAESAVRWRGRGPWDRGRRRTRSPRSAVRMLLPVLAVPILLLAGCARIPSGGPVLPGRSVGEAPGAFVRIYGIPPAPGATPEEIVRGFLRAAADVGNDRQEARTYLAPSRRSAWRPDSSVVVFQSESQLGTAVYDPSGHRLKEPAAGVAGRAASPSAGASAAPGVVPVPAPLGSRVNVRLSVPVSARVDASGHYTIAPPGARENRTFGLVSVNGNWRIDQLADGVLMTRSDFEGTYWDPPVYFADPTGTWLVPDVRWFPIGAATPTTLVRAVLAGPPAWLGLAVTTGAPTGTAMTQPSVPVQNGVATVDLTREALMADPEHRQMLKAQLESTLARQPAVSQVSIDEVAITVESARFDITSGPALSASGGKPAEPGPRLLLNPVAEDWPVVVEKGKLARLDGRQLVSPAGLAGLAVPGVAWPAVASDGSAYAALVGGNRLLYQVAGGKAVTLVSTAGQLVAPSFDPIGWVWTAQATPGGAVLARRPDLPQIVVRTVGWPAGLRITALRISRDGTRAVVAGQRGSVGYLFACGVQRDSDQAPVALGAPTSLLPDLLTVRSVAWKDQRHVVVLGRRAGQPEQVWVVEVGGETQATAVLPGAAVVTAGNGEIYVGASDGGVYRWATAFWERIAAAAWPSMPG